MSTLKNYYEILGINYDASTFDIENAYQKLAAQWHPDKHKTDRALAEKKFHDISEAYEVLSDNNKRTHYNDMLRLEFSLEDANQTFERFFGEHGIMDEQQEKFFNTHYPDQTKNYYGILGVPRNASADQIKRAYRKLALKYHPKNNPNNQQAHKKFVQINEAYNALSNDLKRKTYDDVLFGQIEPVRAHSIFDDFFGNRLFQYPEEDEFFKPIVNRSWRKRLDNMMDTEDDFGDVQNGESVKTSTVYTNNNGVQSKKTVSTKKKVKQGKAIEQTTEEYVLPSGAKQVTKTIKDGQKITTKKYHLKKGEEAPKQLTN